MDKILLRGARTHNLKNVDLELPRDKLIVMTGLSGSGKSSLAFDTIYAEGQRRYVESLSAYARQFLSMMEKPDIDHIEGLSPAISIEQKSTSHNPRSTVGTVTEIYDYLRLLFARVGTPRCPNHDVPLEAQTVSQMVDQVLALPAGSKQMLLAPVVRDRKGEHVKLLAELQAQGFIRARIDGEIIELDDPPTLDPKKKHSIEVIIDRFKVRDDLQQRLAESFETALHLAEGIANVASMEDDSAEPLVFSEKFACPHCGYAVTELEPKLFSFNSPAGACNTCDGLGSQMYFDPDKLINNDDLSLNGGVIRGWEKRNGYYNQLLQSVANHYDFDLDTPWHELSKKHRAVILHGSGRTKIEFVYVGQRGNSYQRTHTFEGVLGNMERRYRETESSMVRDELVKYMSSRSCPTCGGSRLTEAARHVYVDQYTLPEIAHTTIGDAQTLFQDFTLPGQKGEIAEKIIKEIALRLKFLVDVGLDYLTLERSADTLSGGEAQRIRLASQIGAGLVGVMYVLDEPSIGLHQRDNERLLNTLNYLRDLGNTVIVVEHDEDAIRAADHVVDIGPGAGVHGGEIIFSGMPKQLLKNKQSLTGDYLSGRKSIAVPAERNQNEDDQWVTIRGARANNLQNLTVSIPMRLMTCVTGVSGSGKSTLINDTLYRHAAKTLNRAHSEGAECDGIDGLEQLDKVIDINQAPIGRTPRSNPATYTGLFTPIRELFAGTPEARTRGYKAGRFSFNVKGGRCEACQGDGLIKVEMHFLPDVYVPCDECHGKRYNRETLEVKYKGKNIHEVLQMTIEDAYAFFEPVPVLKKKLKTLVDVGLSYITLGQSAITLSGGEAQRVKLAKELSRRDTGSTLYILDEPTTGLHFHDIAQLLKVLNELRDRGNTVVIIEHNLDVIKTADWIIDIGPEGGYKGGTVVAEGTPETVAASKKSFTGHFLQPLLNQN